MGRYRSSNGDGVKAVLTLGGVLLVFIIICAGFATNPMLGVGGWGPENRVRAKVIRTYVDISGSGDNKQSHYMVATDKGVFEVQNGYMLGTWNADELYGRLKNDTTYLFTTKGNKVVNWWMQEYPYIIQVNDVPPDPPPAPAPAQIEPNR